MGICKICKTEQPEVFDDNPICWDCGFKALIDKIFPPQEPDVKETKNTSSYNNEVELIF